MDDPLVEPVSGRGRRPARPGRDPAGGGAAPEEQPEDPVNAVLGNAGRHLAPRRRDPVRRADGGAARRSLCRLPRPRAPRLEVGGDVWCTWDAGPRPHVRRANRRTAGRSPDPAATGYRRIGRHRWQMSSRGLKILASRATAQRISATAVPGRLGRGGVLERRAARGLRRGRRPTPGGGGGTPSARRRARGPAELLPLGRVRRPRGLQGVHAGVRLDHEDRRLRLERGGDREARRRPPGPAATTSSCPPASSSRRWSRTTCSRSSTSTRSRTSRTSTTVYTRPAVGPGQQVLGLQGLGLDRLDLRHDEGLVHRSRLERLHRRRRRTRRAARSRCSTRRATSTGMYFWANGIDWTTTETADLDACEEFMVNELAPHIKAYDSYPGIALTEGKYALSQVWNGDARQGLLSADDPDRLRVGPGRAGHRALDGQLVHREGRAAPEGGPRLDQLHLDPEVSLKDLEYHGYNTGIDGVQEAAEAAGLAFLDIVFFTDEQVATMRRRGRERGPAASGRHLEQGQGRRGSLIPRCRSAISRERRRGRGAPAPTRAPLRAGDPRVDVASCFFFAIPVLLDRVVLVRLQAGHLPDDRDGPAVVRPVRRGVLRRRSATCSRGTLRISLHRARSCAC